MLSNSPGKRGELKLAPARSSAVVVVRCLNLPTILRTLSMAVITSTPVSEATEGKMVVFYPFGWDQRASKQRRASVDCIPKLGTIGQLQPTGILKIERITA